jgi:putative hydrolase of the HAD superfamily
MKLRGRFDAIASAADPEILAFKPDPRGLTVVAERLGVKPREALYIGDRAEVDARAAASAGMLSAIIGRRRTNAAQGWLEVRNYQDLTLAVAQL